MPPQLMPIEVSIVQRAFQVARSGEYHSVEDVKHRLEREGYFDVEEHFFGCPLLRKQLRDAMGELALSTATNDSEQRTFSAQLGTSERSGDGEVRVRLRVGE